MLQRAQPLFATYNYTIDTFTMESIPRTEDVSAHSDDSNHDSTTDKFQDESIQDDKKPTIGAQENTRVIYSRVLVGVVLVVCAALTASLAYLITDHEEQSRFESEVSSSNVLRLFFWEKSLIHPFFFQFAGLASEIIEVSQHAEDNLVKIMNDFGTLWLFQ